MDIQKQIKELVLSFFQIIDSEIIENDRIYTITIPKKYVNYFQKSKIIITFDEKIADEHNCELIIPGNKTLFQIINNCNNKGPISIKKSLSGGSNSLIRYYFYVNFSGVKQNSELFSITVDLDNMQVVEPPSSLLEIMDTPSDFKINLEKITPCFDVALNELKQNSSDLKSSFVNEANLSFESDFNLFISRYDDEIRELDESINQKEQNLNDFEKIRDYRFNTLEKIKNIEKDKNSVLKSLQEKHKIDLSYELIACEFVLN